MKNIIFLGVIFLSISKSYGFESMICFTPQDRHEVMLNENKLTLIDHTKPQDRSIASFKGNKNIRTKFIGSSLTKVLNQDGYKHTIHIQDIHNFNSFDDYMSIQSPKGHIMTFPLECKRS